MSLPRSCGGDALGIRLLTDVGHGGWVCVVIAMGVYDSALYRSAIFAFLWRDFSLSASWVHEIPLSLQCFTIFSSSPIGGKYRPIWLPYRSNDTRMYAFSLKLGRLAHRMIGLMIIGWILSEGANSLHFIIVCYLTFLMMAVASNLDPARMGSMETRSAYGCLSDIPNYARNRGGDISDENLPSWPAMFVHHLLYWTIISPQLTPHVKLVQSHTQNLSVAFSPVQSISCTWIGLYSWFTKLVSIHFYPGVRHPQLIVSQ